MVITKDFQNIVVAANALVDTARKCELYPVLLTF